MEARNKVRDEVRGATEIKEECRAFGEREELGLGQIPWRVPGRSGSVGRREIRFLGLCRSCRGGSGRILEADFLKNRDLAQLKSDVFMNGIGKSQGHVSRPAGPLL